MFAASGEQPSVEEEAVLEAQPSGAVQPASAFWDELLKAGYQDLQQAQMQALGKGKRERRQVHHCLLCQSSAANFHSILYLHVQPSTVL